MADGASDTSRLNHRSEAYIGASGIEVKGSGGTLLAEA
jgi:hypothetical protein